MSCKINVIVLALVLLSKPINPQTIGLHNHLKASISSSSCAIAQTLKDFYCEKSSVVDVIHDGNNFNISNILNALVTEFHSCTSFQINSMQKASPLESRKKVFNLIILEKFASFAVFAQRLSSFNFDFNGYFMVLFIEIKLSEVDKVFEIAWKHFMHNFNVVTVTEANISMLTYEPFRSGKCGDTSSQLKYVNSLNESMALIDLFPNKMNNLHRCPLRLPRLDYFPAILFSKDPNDSVVTGIEGDLLMAIKDALNFTIKVVVLENESDKWGRVYENGTSTGAMKKVIDGDADLLAAMFAITQLRLKYMDSIQSHLGFPFVLVVPPGAELTPFEKLLRPYHFEIWVALAFVFFYGFLFIFTINRCKSERMKRIVFGETLNPAYLNMIDISFGGSLHLLPKRNFPRILLALFLLFSLVMRNIYQGLLFQFLQSDDRARPVMTVDEMIDKDFHFFMYSIYQEHTANLKIHSRRRVYEYPENESYLKKTLDPSFKGGVCSTLDEVLSLNKLNYKKFTYRILPEYLYSFKNGIYFTKNSPYVNAFNKKIGLFKSSGLIEFFIAKYVDMSYLNMKVGSKAPRRLNLEPLKGGFLLWIYGCLGSFIVFVIESLYSKCKRYLEK